MTILLSVIVLGLVIGGMSIGVIMGRKPIQGSCGGLNAVGLKGECEICGGNVDKCENQNLKNNNTNSTELAENAMEDHKR